MINKKSWNQFKNSGMFWFVNRTLHLLGWVIVYEINKKGDITKVYPARTKFRGFSSDIETKGFKLVSKYLSKNSNTLLKEAES